MRDEKGTVLFADDLQSVPAKYQGQAMIVSTEDVDEKAEQAAAEERVQSAAQAQAVVQERVEQQAAAKEVQPAKNARDVSFSLDVQGPGFPVAWTLGAVGTFLAVLIILPRIDALRYYPKAVDGVRSSLAILLLVYLVIAHGKDVVRLFGMAGKSISDMEQKSAERGKKAAQFYKEMEKMMEQAETVQKEQDAQYKALEEQ